MNQFSRTTLLIGQSGIQKLNKSKVIIFGIGGVGSYTAEALARSGIGHIELVDNDKVTLTNLNRQLIATMKTIGRYKTEVMKERIEDINPNAKIITHNCFYMPDNSNQFNLSNYDYVIDAIDTITAKIEIIIQSKNAGTKVISSMGAGNKLEASLFEVSDIYKTSVCPLAKVMRRELKKRNIDNLKVVYSKEPPIQPEPFEEEQKSSSKKIIPGSVAFVPSVVGMIIAGEVIKDIVYG